MKRLVFLFFMMFLLHVPSAFADEGMWLLSLLNKNYEQMKRQGFQLTTEDIYRVNQGCLKDAVIGLGHEGSPFWHFCTGELISAEGLFTTNHHCGFSMIQSHSTVEHDYLRDGFWAMSREEELPNEGITAAILVRMEDVTPRILGALDEQMSEKERNKIIDSLSNVITQEATEGTVYEAQVADMFSKNQFFMLVYVIYKDVRLVGAPPSSMGKFGGDTDNWEWPRHTADFSMFRIYTDKDGNPASYSKENVPLKPKHFFPVSIKGLKEGDFAMIMGFPGTTKRFLTSYGLNETMNITNQLRYDIRTVKINVLREKMAASRKVRIQYATKYATCSNYWKYSIQQNKALKNLNTLAVKQAIEHDYQQWAENQSNPKYKEALGKIEDAYNQRAKNRASLLYLTEGILSGTETPYFALQQVDNLMQLLPLQDADSIETMKTNIKKEWEDFYKDFAPEVERELLANMLGYVHKNMNKEDYPEFITNVLEKKFRGDASKYADFIISKSVFASREKLEAVLSHTNGKKMGKILMNDPAFVIGLSTYQRYQELGSMSRRANSAIAEGERYFVDGLLQMKKDHLFAPDANSTIRLTYGNVREYEPKDGVTYHYYTTLKGVMQKEDPSNSEFIVPEKLKTLYQKKDFAPYSDKNGDLPVCFITNNDITGGNSGSPVLDAMGNLIGLAFDGNSEAMSGDIDFEEDMQRCINLDVRYMLFIIDKFAGAKHLLEEMSIVK
ncbi:MAG: S46 family peptidase [Bacteroidales bacterium]|jgi:V8-like Glu-specific endopeptidase|nr:S46 family peptidase [Bacteroidales bacterium]